MTILAALAASKALWMPLLTMLIGILNPPPEKREASAQIDVSAAEKRADQTGDVADLDVLP